MNDYIRKIEKIIEIAENKTFKPKLLITDNFKNKIYVRRLHQLLRQTDAF